MSLRLAITLYTLALTMNLYAADASTPYASWGHSGSFFILTTPEGADLPATASEDGFPLLVRLNMESFDFGQAKPKGEDLRVASSSGAPLSYQIEEWNAVGGLASIWVRVPTIKGNARQEIKMFWGKADANSESSGAAVFNESNGYLSVWHMNEPVKDEVGTLESKDVGTTAGAGLIGSARHLAGKQGIFCGDKIPNYPSGSSSHSSQAWIRAEQANCLVLAWGNEQAQGKVTMRVASPPQIQMECYFSGADVRGASRIRLADWVHVVHTYSKGNSRIYLNGCLEGVNSTSNSPLAIKSPARMWIGGWYNNFSFVGDLDEVRISKVVRSAEWVKLEYENQKPLQTLVGSLVQPASDFAVSTNSLTVSEGKSATVTAKAGGAQKTYWLLKRDGNERAVAVDRDSYTLDAGRVVGDTSYTLQFKAVYASEVKTKEISVTIKEEIPEPVVMLKAPADWNGRDTIVVEPTISNLAEMQAKGAGNLNYKWSVSGGAVIKEIAPDKLILKRSQYSGPITVNAVIDNGGRATSATASIQVTEPKSEPWIERVPGKDEKPEDGQFYARDDKNEGTLYYNGTLEQPADAVFLKVYADDKIYKTDEQKAGADKAYAFTVKLKPGLVKYKVEFGTKNGGTETIAQTVSNLVCGDAYLIEGQSNALATDTSDKSPPETNEWIRSYGSPHGDQKGPPQNLWCNPVWKAQKGDKAELGWWGMELAKRMLESQKIPIFIVNAAVGGTRIDQHQRNVANPTDLSTIYGRMLWRMQKARMTHGIRCVIWHQGEADQGSDGPDGGYGWETYQNYFVEMSAGWKQDMPNIQHYYIFQIWPNACAQGGGHGNMLRETQRTLPLIYSKMDIMSTLGIKPPGGCHYPLAGWSEFARLIQPLIERDFYGKAPTIPITPANLKQVYFTSPAKDAIAVEFDQPVLWSDAATSQFFLDGAKEKIASGSVSGNVITLKLKDPSTAQKITYVHELSWNQDKLIFGTNAIAALTFCDVPIASTASGK